VSRLRWLPLSGIGFVVLGLLSVVVLGGSTPDTNASAAKVASFYDAHNVRQSVAAFILAASVPFLALFGAQLAAAFSALSLPESVWPRFLVAGTAAASAVWLLTALIHFALADAADQRVSGDAIRALNVLDGDSWIAWNAGLGVMMLAAAGAALTVARLLPRWLGWAALVLGVALFIPFADFFALLLTLIWILVVSVMLGRSGDVGAVAQPS
jgi:hypothetical protein